MKRLQYLMASIVLCGCASTVSLQETSYYEQGKAALASKSYNLAQAKFQLALHDVEHKAHALNGLAATFFEMQNDEAALAFIRSARAIDSNSEYFKNNEAKILGRIQSTQRNARASVEPEPVKLGKVDITPAVVDFSAGSAMLPVRDGKSQIEATSARLAAGYERRLPTAQLEQVSPGVFNLVLSPRKDEVVADQNLSNLASALGSALAPSERRLAKRGAKVSDVVAKAASASVSLVTYGRENAPTTRIAISNGSGIKGVACGTAETLRKAGISVTTCADYKTKDGKVNFKQTETVLYVNRRSQLNPELILELIRSSNAKRLVVTNLVAAKLDVQLVLGKDHRVITRRV